MTADPRVEAAAKALAGWRFAGKSWNESVDDIARAALAAADAVAPPADVKESPGARSTYWTNAVAPPAPPDDVAAQVERLRADAEAALYDVGPPSAYARAVEALCEEYDGLMGYDSGLVLIHRIRALAAEHGITEEET